MIDAIVHTAGEWIVILVWIVLTLVFAQHGLALIRAMPKKKRRTNWQKSLGDFLRFK